MENQIPQNVGSIRLLAVITEVAQWEFLVAVDHNQLLTTASETVDPIDWSHPPLSWAVPPELHVLYGVNVQIARLVAPTGTRTRVHGYDRPTHYLCGHSGYEWPSDMESDDSDIALNTLIIMRCLWKSGKTVYLTILWP